MTDDELHVTPRLSRMLMSEEAVYGLILVSGMIVVSGSAESNAVNAFITVAVTVLVFFAAHVYAGTLGRLAASNGHAGLRASLRGSMRQSSGMLLAAVVPLVILLLGATDVVADSTALWTALFVNTVLLGALGWVAVSRWSTHWAPRLLSALITAAFGGVLIVLKAVIHH
jgi:hypothetical protein